MNIDRKNLRLFVIAMFFLGLAVGIGGKLLYDAPALSPQNPIHLLLIFSAGMGLGGILTRIRYERKMENLAEGTGFGKN